MESIERAQEWLRLEQLYAQMSEGELQAVADEGYELSEIAQQALRAEISRRGLDIQIRDAPSDNFDPSDLNLVCVWRVWDSSEARRAKHILDSVGLPSYLGPDNLENVDALNSSFDAGVDLKVREIDSQRALHALAQLMPPEPEDDTDYVARCPKCHSPEIVFQGLDAEPATDSARVSKFNWGCDACGHQWADDGIEQE